MGETSKKQEPQKHNLNVTVGAEITESNQPSLRRGFWKVWAKGATPGANELMLSELIQSKNQTVDPLFQYDQNTVYLAYVNTVQSPGDIQLGLFFDDFQSNESEESPIVKKEGPNKPTEYEVYLAGPSSIKYPSYKKYKKGWVTDIVQTDKTAANVQSVSVCNNWLNIRPLNGAPNIFESPVVSLAASKDDPNLYQKELNKRSQIYKTYLSDFVYPLTSRGNDTTGKSEIYDRYNYQNRDVFVHLINSLPTIDDAPGKSDDEKKEWLTTAVAEAEASQESAANALASLLLLKANSSAYLDKETAAFEDVKLFLTLTSNSPIFNNTILRSENGEYNSKETLGDPKIGFQWYYPKRSAKDTDYIVQFGVPELCCEFLARGGLETDKYPKPFTLDGSLAKSENGEASIQIDILAQIFRILLYANSSYGTARNPETNELNELDKVYNDYRNGVNRSWGKIGTTVTDYWNNAALEEKKYIRQYYNSKNKARIVQDIKALFGSSEVKLDGINDQIQIPRGLYISLGQNPWSPYYSEEPKIGGLLSEDYKDQHFRKDERLTDITLDLSLDDQVTIKELGGSEFTVAIKEDSKKKIYKKLHFTFKPHARGANMDSETLAIARAVVKEDGKITGDYNIFHYDDFVRASRDLEKKKDNKFFIYNRDLKNSKVNPDNSSNIYTYVRCVHLPPNEYDRNKYQSIAKSCVEKTLTADSKKTVEIDFDHLFTEPALDPKNKLAPISINLSSNDFVIDHKYTENKDANGTTVEKIKETTCRNVSLYLVGVLNYHIWGGKKSFDISVNTEKGTDGETQVLGEPKTPYSILGVPVVDKDAYSKLNGWLYKALSIKKINDPKSKPINVSSSDLTGIYPQRASSTLLKNWKIGAVKSLANDLNKAVIFDPYDLSNDLSKSSITPGAKYGTAPVNYYYVAAAIDYTKKETTDKNKTTKQTSNFEPFKIDFTKNEGGNDKILYSLPVDFKKANEEANSSESPGPAIESTETPTEPTIEEP